MGRVMKAGALLAPSAMFVLSWSAPFCWRFWRVLAAFAPGLSPLSSSPFPLGEGAGLGGLPSPWPFSPLRERVLGGSWDPRPVYSWFLPLSREMSLPCKAVTPVLASRMPTSIARRHWGCSPSSNFLGRLTGPCGTACVSRFVLPPAKASGCAGYGPPGRPRVRTWNGGDAFSAASSWRGAETQTNLPIPRVVPSQHQRRYDAEGRGQSAPVWSTPLRAVYQTSTAVLGVSRGSLGQFGGNFRDSGEW